MNWIKKKLKAYYPAILISIVILFILESLSSVIYYQAKKPDHYFWSSSVEALNRLFFEKDFSNNPRYDRLKHINSSKKDMMEIYPNYVYQPQLHHPSEPYYLANAVSSNIIGCNESGYFNEWKSDRYGFRNPIDTYKSKSDILLIGDSFAEGACENEDGTIAGRLRSIGYKVANLGRQGSGPLHQLGTLVEYGGQYPSKSLVWIVFTGNDMHNLREEKTTKLANYLKKNYKQNLVSNKTDIDISLKSFLDQEFLNANIRMSDGIFLYQNDLYGESLDLLEAQKKETALLLEVAARIQQEAENNNVKFKIVILNHVNYVPQIQNIMSKTLRQFADSKDIQYLEFSRGYLKRNINFYSETGPHFNSFGYKSIADKIHSWIAQDNSEIL